MNFLPQKQTSKISLLFSFIISILFSSAVFSSEINSQYASKQDELNAILAQHKGKVIYIDFWASWCGPCRKSFPWMNKIQNTYDTDKFTVISINLDNDITLAEKFLQTLPANFPVIYDPNGELAKRFNVKGMPSSYLANQEGKIVRQQTGFFTEESTMYENEINQLLNSPNTTNEIAIDELEPSKNEAFNNTTGQRAAKTKYESLISKKHINEGQHENS